MIKWVVVLIMYPVICFGHFDAELVRVIDGDTILLDIKLLPGNTARATIRIDSIDTPEKRSTSKRKVPECEKVLAVKAQEYTELFLLGGDIQLDNVFLGTYASRARDDEGVKLPGYIGEIFVNGESLGESLLDSGNAKVFSRVRQSVHWCDQ